VSLLERSAPAPGSDPAEALIKEAHERKRRRRLIVAATTALLLAGALGGYLVARPAHPVRTPPAPRTGARPPVPERPALDTAAFAHRGRLAFVSRGTLWVVDGSTGSVHAVRTRGLVPTDPTFSPDGRWLAFVASREEVETYGNQVLSSTLWWARSDGTGAHRVSGIVFAAAYGWNPRRDLFAVGVGSAPSVPYGDATAVDLVSPTGAIRTVVGETHVTSAVWSPDGSALAVSTEYRAPGAFNDAGADLSSYPLGGGPPTVWLRSATEEADFVVTAGWWPVWGIGYTTVGGGGVPGGSASLDGSPFSVLSRPGATPRLLGRTLEDGGAGAPSVSSNGWLAFVGDTGDDVGRLILDGKQVVVCSPVTADCTVVPHPPAAVTVDPVWSPRGSTLVWAQAPALNDVDYGPATVMQWYDSHQLEVYDPTTGAVRPDARARGVTVPRWSTDGTSLLYVSNDGLWLDADLASSPVEIAQPLFTPGDWPQYYGQVDFSSQFSWWSG
jgi:Tol biopolymer transport system component